MTKVAYAISLVVFGVVLTLSKIVYIVCFFIIMLQVINDDDEAEGNTRSVKHNMSEKGGEPLPSLPIMILMFLHFIFPLFYLFKCLPLAAMQATFKRTLKLLSVDEKQ